MSVQDSPQPLFAAVSLERRIVELTILYEVSQALQNTLDEEKALYTILVGVTAGRGLGFNRAFILLVDHEEQFLSGRLAVGPSSAGGSRLDLVRVARQTGVARPAARVHRQNRHQQTDARQRNSRAFPDPVVGQRQRLVRAMRSRQACLASRSRLEPHACRVDRSIVEILGTDTFAIAPLYLADRELGLLIADNAITGKPVDLTNVRLLQIYAQEASAAIQNTRLYRELMEKVELCENTNVTLRENQYHLLQAERLSTIGKMAALLAHEIRTPLVSIGGFARRLMRSTPDDDPRKEEMEIIVSEVARLERLVQEVLGYSKITKPEYEDDGRERARQEHCDDAAGRPRKERRDPVRPGSGNGSATCRGRCSQMRQALFNLIINGMDAMPSGGTLTVTSDSEADHLEIVVKDTGIGIAREHWSKLFSPFFTTKMTGTGLGLAIVSQVVENHKGSLRFESIPGQGTSFHIRLALNPQAKASCGTFPPRRSRNHGRYPHEDCFDCR